MEFPLRPNVSRPPTCLIRKVCNIFLQAMQVGGEAMDPKFSLSSDDCELLLAFEKASTLERLSRLIHRDTSAVSRRLKHLSAKAPVIEKMGNRWRLTALGTEINRWTEEALSQQARTLAKPTEIKIGASRMFASKVLARKLSEIQDGFKPHLVSLVSLDGSLEPYLLNGTIDIAFTCGRPEDPAIAHKSVARERYVAAASRNFSSRHKPTAHNLYRLPFLAFRNTTGRYPFAELSAKAKNTVGIFNDPISLFEAVSAGVGWSVLPYFSLETNNQLSVIPFIEIETENYGVWWLRERKSTKRNVDFALRWLEGQRL